ncbi:MAG: uracil-DNA glycosylase [Janthinobacterium lividum]
MSLSGEMLRGYLDYLRDLGVYDLYRSSALPVDPAVAEQLQTLIQVSSAVSKGSDVSSRASAELRAAAPVAGREGTASPIARAAAPVRAAQPLRAAQTLRTEQSGPSIVITPVAAPQPLPAQIATPASPSILDDESSPTDTGPFAPPAMPLISFTNLAPLPAVRVARNDKAAALQALRAEIGDCTRCPLAYAGRHNIVFADGDPNARLMFVGEGPGADEDASGLPFVGKAGQLLNNMIGAMGLPRESVYIANVVMCRPPKNRVPEPVEANTCSQFLLRQIDIVQPQVIVALGATAALYLLGMKQSLANLRGQWHDVRGAKCAVTYHPAFLLRDPRQKGEAWKDLQRVMVELDLKPPIRG